MSEYEFIQACTNGNIKEVQQLFALASTIPNGIVGIDISANEEEAFRSACANGHLEVAQWLYQVKPDIDILANKEDAFCSACFWGHLNVAQWLLSIKPNIDITADKDWIFRWTYINGHLEVIYWLITVRPDKYTLKSTKPIIRNEKEQLWYKMHYLVELTNNKKHKNNKKHALYYLSADIIWLLSFYI